MCNLVVARYQEGLDWITNVPDPIKIFVYNKGSTITEPRILERVECVVARRNFGREAETYLHHLISAEHEEEGTTIFCQGEPFSHSPDFLKLLESWDCWQDVQPLTDRWLTNQAVPIPPLGVLAEDRSEDLGGLRVRTEIFSLYHFNALHYHDEGGVQIGNNYRSGHGLTNGTNLIAHFLKSAGWNELAEEAQASDFGQFNYGAMFAVKNHLIQRIPPDVLRRFHLMSRSHNIYAYIFERLWLHLFGLPFHPALQRLKGSSAKFSNPAR